MMLFIYSEYGIKILLTEEVMQKIKNKKICAESGNPLTNIYMGGDDKQTRLNT